jgi:flagellar FliJ protein
VTSTRFQFSLERVRALRERDEDAAREALAGALAERLHHESLVLEATQTVEHARRLQLDTAAAPVGAEELMARQAFLERSERTHRATRERLGHSEQRERQRRETLAAAARDRQALERLKERRRDDHERELARRESLALDEIALGVFRRREAA